MAHVESGSCEGFTEEQYRAQRIQKRATRAALEGQIGGRRALPGACGTTASVAESLDGGVRLNILDDSELPIPERRMRDIVARASIGDAELDDATSKISGITHSTKQWPTMVLDDKNGKEKCDNDDLMAFSDLGIDDTEDSNMAANEEETGELDDWGEAPPMESGEQRLKEHFTLWDTDQLYNTVLGAYVCPCDKVFRTSEEISDHLNSGIHDGGVVYCPVCFRPFKTTTSLVAHVESATSRCNVGLSSNLGKIIDDISGGVIEAGGYNKDGTVKFAAAPKQEIKPINLDAISW
ncbi:hypothetical protein LOZ65_005683 [Ophidiomyces ophidiicola]|nr:hypothetical protein LOZ65_005683 [Ophidiomyces ophidiicola]